VCGTNRALRVFNISGSVVWAVRGSCSHQRFTPLSETLSRLPFFQFCHWGKPEVVSITLVQSMRQGRDGDGVPVSRFTLISPYLGADGVLQRRPTHESSDSSLCPRKARQSQVRAAIERFVPQPIHRGNNIVHRCILVPTRVSSPLANIEKRGRGRAPLRRSNWRRSHARCWQK
jgi:hypothetical protein